MESLLQNVLLTFVLVLARVGGLVTSAPLLGSTEIPMRVRAMLALMLAVLLTPIAWSMQLTMPTTPIELGVLMLCETLLGMILGLGMMITLSGVQLAGQLISQLSGLSLADVFNPGFDEQVPLLANFLYLFTLTTFVVAGGHREMIDGLLNTLTTVPLGTAGVPASLSELIVQIASDSFVLGIRIAAPAMVALLLATVVLGIIGRTLPQLNVLVLGFGINSLVMMSVVAISLGSAAWLTADYLDSCLTTLVGAFQRVAAVSG